MRGARLDGCERRPPATQAHGVSRPSLAAVGGNADALRDVVRDYVIEQLADDDAVLVALLQILP